MDYNIPSLHCSKVSVFYLPAFSHGILKIMFPLLSQTEQQRPKCEPVRSQKCLIVPEIVAKKDCQSLPRQTCSSVDRNVCQSVSRQYCQPGESEENCLEVPTTHCTPLVREVTFQSCKTVKKRQCLNIPKYECHDRPSRKCFNIEVPYCKSVPKELCLQKECKSKQCKQVPRTECSGYGK